MLAFLAGVHFFICLLVYFLRRVGPGSCRILLPMLYQCILGWGCAHQFMILSDSRMYSYVKFGWYKRKV